MRTLTLVRHAKSSWKDSSLRDHERPLSARGKRDAPVMGERIVDAGLRPSLVISSPAVRAWKTATIVADAIGYPKEFLQRESELYLASRRVLLDVIARQDTGFRNLMLFGHNPGLTDCANFLVPDLTDNVPTAGVVAIEFDAPDWRLHERPALELLIFDYPKKASAAETGA